jgi:GT2 family glycosyltransferase
MNPIHNGVAPLVSVLIVTYNGRKHVGACLTSVLDQDLPREQYEVVVVDNASRDQTADWIAQNFPAVRVIRLDQNYGPNTAVRLARPHLRGRYIAYANQDVVAHRRWLSELLQAMMSHPRAGIVESNMILPQWLEYNPALRDAPVQRAYVCDLTPLSIQDFRIVPVTPTTPPIHVLSAYCAACLMNPEILDQLGYWTDEGFFAYFDDIDLGLRLNASGYEVLMAPRSLVYHDTIWLFQWSRRSVRRAFLSTRNMILVYYKLCYPSEFFRLLPRLFLGKLLRAGQHNPTLVGKLAYALVATPLLVISLVAAVLKMPRYRKLRKLTMSHRITPPGWIVESLRNLDWGADRAVWAEHRTVAKQGNGL